MLRHEQRTKVRKVEILTVEANHLTITSNRITTLSPCCNLSSTKRYKIRDAKPERKVAYVLKKIEVSQLIKSRTSSCQITINIR